MKSTTTMEATSVTEPAMVPAVVPAFEVGGTTVEILIALGIIAIAVRTVIVVVVFMVFLGLSSWHPNKRHDTCPSESREPDFSQCFVLHITSSKLDDAAMRNVTRTAVSLRP
jgi:hypothetical protein